MKTLLILLLTTLITYSAEYGIASHYSIRTNGGTHTASGQRLDDNKLTAAHKTLPFGTRVKVTCLSTNRSVIVTINNRGPFIAGRIIDLSQAAAKKLNMIKKGLTRVKVEVIK